MINSYFVLVTTLLLLPPSCVSTSSIWPKILSSGAIRHCGNCRVLAISFRNNHAKTNLHPRLSTSRLRRRQQESQFVTCKPPLPLLPGKQHLNGRFRERIVSRRLLASLKDWDLIAAARDNDVERVKQLLDEGCNINGQDFFGLTPLHWATARASNDAAQLLIEGGANMNSQSTRFLWLDGISMPEGTTPVFVAASLNRIEILEKLIAKGADVIGKAANGWTPLHRAAEQGQYHCTMALLNAKANVNAKTNYGETPLMCAAFKGEIDIAQALLDAGSEKEERTSEGDTALHRAAANFSNAKMIEFLSKTGCDTNSQNYEGWTPLHKSAWTMQPDGIKVLVNAGADINSKDFHGKTPLHVAAARGGTPQGTETVKVLLDLGAEKGLQNNSGRTPKEVICQQLKECPNRTELEHLL